MAIRWPTNLLHFHLNKLFTKWFPIWHYFVWQLIWLLLKNWAIFSKSSGQPGRGFAAFSAATEL
jgi:hypothetical protein